MSYDLTFSSNSSWHMEQAYPRSTSFLEFVQQVLHKQTARALGRPCLKEGSGTCSALQLWQRPDKCSTYRCKRFALGNVPPKKLLMRCFPLETPASHCWISTEAKARVGAIAAKLLNPLSRHTCSPASCPNEPAKKNITEQPSSIGCATFVGNSFFQEFNSKLSK